MVGIRAILVQGVRVRGLSGLFPLAGGVAPRGLDSASMPLTAKTRSNLVTPGVLAGSEKTSCEQSTALMATPCSLRGR